MEFKKFRRMKVYDSSGYNYKSTSSTVLAAVDAKLRLEMGAERILTFIRNYCYLHSTDYPAEGNCVIFHKDKASHPYHLHGRSGTLLREVRSIKKHEF